MFTCFNRFPQLQIEQPDLWIMSGLSVSKGKKLQARAATQRAFRNVWELLLGV
jgi:hypothetical protein